MASASELRKVWVGTLKPGLSILAAWVATCRYDLVAEPAKKNGGTLGSWGILHFSDDATAADFRKRFEGCTARDVVAPDKRLQTGYVTSSRHTPQKVLEHVPQVVLPPFRVAPPPPTS